MNDLRHWMDVLTEGLPAAFEHSNWGYWIEPDGTMKPVSRHQHYIMYRIGWEVFASGRIRVTSITDPTQVKTESGMRVFAANFFSHFVTKRALRSMMLLLREYDFDVYTIAGMTYRDEAAFNSPMPDDMTVEQHDAIRIDSRSCIDALTKNAAIASARAFLSTALDAAPKMLDAAPETWSKRRVKR